MGKLRLSVEALRVESFHTAAPLHARGTVRGAEDYSKEPCETNASGCIIASCGETCPITCEASCRFVCDETFDGCETNASGCVILSCGATCALSCGGSCGNLCDL
jgi:hypothetical protein